MMKLSRYFPVRTAALFCVVAFGGVLLAQPPEVGEAQPEHKWLAKFEGTWEAVNKTVAAEGQEASTIKGSFKSKMIGAHWLVTEMDADFDGFKMEGRQTIGYDSETKKYIGTWIDSSSDFMWKYNGSVSKDGSTLSLLATGPDMAQPGKSALYRDRYQFVSDDEMKVTSSVQGEDGKWVDFMTGVAKRKK